MLRRLVRGILTLTLLAIVVPPLQVLSLRWIDPPFTFTMLEVAWEASSEAGGPVWVDHASGPLSSLGEVPRMAVTAEDDAFWHHHGFDLGSICGAVARNQEAGHVVAGGSTITQQTAKNIFLWQERSWVRKGLETMYVAWMELLLPKERILELYMGIVEVGPATFGVEAGARRWFGRPAAGLSRLEAARLMWMLPQPTGRTPHGEAAGAFASKLVGRAAVWPGERGFDAVGEAWESRARSRCGI